MFRSSSTFSLIFIFFSLAPLSSVHGELVSMTVARSKDHIFTSREVHMQHLLEISLQGEKQFETFSEDSKKFFGQVEKTLVEHLVSTEAAHFSSMRLLPEEKEKARNRLSPAVFQSAAWKKLAPTKEEWEEVFFRKVQANKFIQFRAQSSVIPISDSEARKYFDENRLKFGNLPFGQFQENIKIYLRRSQVEQRLKDWYDVLRSKYKARNLLSEI